MRILIVEDHPPAASALGRLLEARGHEVAVAHTVAEARIACDADGFDLLICDIALPDGTGWDLLAAIRHRCEVEAIAVSGFAGAQDVRRSLDAGFRAHLTKPCDPEELADAIRRAVRKS